MSATWNWSFADLVVDIVGTVFRSADLKEPWKPLSHCSNGSVTCYYYFF